MDFERICQIFTMREPFYGILLSSMNRVPVKELPTIGVARSGNVFKLGYNPDYLERLAEEDIYEVLKHEMLHLAFSHFTIWDTDSKHEPEAVCLQRNFAEDLEVNCYLNQDTVRRLGGLLVEKFDFEPNLGAREYYRLLEQWKQQQPQTSKGNPQNKPCDGGLGSSPNAGKEDIDMPDEDYESGESTSDSSSNEGRGQSNPFKDLGIDENLMDDHSQWPNGEDCDLQQIAQDIDYLLDTAAMEVEKACGEIPGEMKLRIEQIRKKPRPVADWKRYFRRYMGNAFTEFVRKSKKRQSRRFPDAAGNRYRRKSNILVAIDTSGSVSMPEYQEFFGQIKTLMPLADFHVLECDAAIQHEYNFNGIIPQDLHGGGGTSFEPVIQYYLNNKKLYDTLIYFTDGYCDVPNDTPKDTLWVISSQGDQNAKKYRVNGASVVFIPKKATQ